MTILRNDTGPRVLRALAFLLMLHLPASRAFAEERDPGRDRERTHAQLIEEVNRSWRTPPALSGALADANIDAAAGPMTEKLNTIILPTVSFAKVPIAQVVMALSAASEEFDPGEAPLKGANIVLLDPDNRAPVVSLTLRNTSLRRVLDFVSEAIGYEYEVQPDAVVLRPVGDTPKLETSFFPVARATVLRMAGRNPEARAAIGKRPPPPGPAGAEGDPVLGDAETAALKRFLQLAGVNFDSLPGASLAYDGSAMIVTQTRQNLERIRTILSRYHAVRQVEIEAKFMEVREGALEELGLNWGAVTKQSQASAGAQANYATGNRTLSDAFTSRSSSQQGGIVRPEATTIASDGTVLTSPELNLPIVNHAPQIPGATDLAALAGPLASVTAAIGEFDVNAVVRALAQKQGTDLLSAPRVTVLSGNPATITVAQEMRYPQSFGQTQSQVGTGNASGGGSAGVAITAGTPQEFTARNVGVELKVTPTVEEDDYSISLDLNPRVTEFDGFVEYGGPSIAIAGSTTVTVPSGFYQPIFSVRDISTKVTVWDGATLVMGGLTREEVKKVQDKVPVLGDLPFLGRLFRSKGTTTQKRNLLIFVTASLVDPGGAPKRQAASRELTAGASAGPAVRGERSAP
ncbi:MAG: type and secretion system protein [Verrucomicrobia bacterium]|nr:type and secretion system protein [Verrucomicrobiota bacterium]